MCCVTGAMENWGLVTYRETALLVDKDNSSSAARQYVALVVGHELAHQWFGNLVTMVTALFFYSDPNPNVNCFPLLLKNRDEYFSQMPTHLQLFNTSICKNFLSTSPNCH